MKLYGCERCPLRVRAERKPESIIGRIWRWHTRWCPGWRAYQRAQAQKPPDGTGE